MGQNLRVSLAERGVETIGFTRAHAAADLPRMLDGARLVYHLAGVNRPRDPREFQSGNVELTERLAEAVIQAGQKIPVIFTSSTQAVLSNEYGRSKRRAEEVLETMQREHAIPVHILRLPGVFGKWCKPNYNSVVATFCHLTARGQPCPIHDPAAPLTLVHIDDVVLRLLSLLDRAGGAVAPGPSPAISPQFETTVGELAAILTRFRESRKTLLTERTGEGLIGKLYGTYLSYLPPGDFAYDVPAYPDPRGNFVEMLKTKDSGQFSYFSIKPGITRGSHYHHRKSEKFLPLHGRIKMCFRNLATGERHEIQTEGGTGRIIETAPGWVHDITNIGKEEAWVMLWANEVFDRQDPDCVPCEV